MAAALKEIVEKKGKGTILPSEFFVVALAERADKFEPKEKLSISWESIPMHSNQKRSCVSYPASGESILMHSRNKLAYDFSQAQMGTRMSTLFIVALVYKDETLFVFKNGLILLAASNQSFRQPQQV